MKFKQKLKDKGIDAAVFFRSEDNKDKSIAYLCQIETEKSFMGMLYYSSEKKKSQLIVSPLEEVETNKSFTLKKFKTKNDLFKTAKEWKPKVIGLNYSGLTVLQHNWLKKELRKVLGKVLFKDISKDIVQSREIKTREELSNIQKAVNITEKIFEKMYRKIPSCKTEWEVVEFLKIETLKAGCEPSYEPIFASGKNACKIHYNPDMKTKMEKGFCVVDFAVTYKGYHADITRTLYIGKPSEKEIDIYTQVKDCLFTIEKNFNTGDSYKELFESNLKIAGFDLQHALGHGIGLDIHELPHLGFAKESAKIGETIAIEPGIYVEAKKSPTKKTIGIRIEDNYLITAKGLKRLSKSSRELKVIN